MAAANTTYSDVAFQNVAAHVPQILEVAQALGISATAIAGAMVEENHDYLVRWIANPAGDAWASFWLGTVTSHSGIVSGYEYAAGLGVLDLPHNWVDKAVHPVLSDVGPFNIKLATAIRLLQDYFANTTGDPLSLGQYQNNYVLLLNHLQSPGSANATAAPAIAGLMILEAKTFFESKVDPTWWTEQSLEQKDALYVTYYNNGPLYSLNRYYEKLNAGEPYQPEPGADHSGGDNHLYNRFRIGALVGASGYGTGVSLPSSGVPAVPFLRYENDHVVFLEKGGTLWHIAEAERNRGNPISADDIAMVNGLSPSQYARLPVGTKLMVPEKVNGNLVVNYGNVSISFNPNTGENTTLITLPDENATVLIKRESNGQDGYVNTYIKTHNTTGEVLQEHISTVGPEAGAEFRDLGPTDDVLDVTNNSPVVPTAPGALDVFANARGVTEGLAVATGLYGIRVPASVLNGWGWPNTELSETVTDGFRPGNYNLTGASFGLRLTQAQIDSFGYTPQTDFSIAGGLNNTWQQAEQKTFTDPLILDLNGDGVVLTDYGSDPVLFDIDNDGGTKESSGWVSSQDGILVHDLNANGVIDNIAETVSEYYNGQTGSDGNAGTRPYAHGFAALKSLDSSGDNLFTAADLGWSQLRVWVDADHDAQTDAGELKTLNELGITQINLATTTQSGLVRGGNEVLASGDFVQGGQTKEALAVRFLANPNGHTFSASGSGTIVSTQGLGEAENGQPISPVSTYVAGSSAGEIVAVASKGVQNAYGNTGSDSLTGDSNNNWLSGGGGSDTLVGGAGDDVLIIDADDLQANIHAGAGTDIIQVVGTAGVSLNLALAEVEVAQGGSGDDILVGGGRSSVFVRGGAGNDVLVGGAAGDALSGEDGDDIVNGAAGNDLLRGHRGRDQMFGGAGDDVIDGGMDDDDISGGTGNDILKGSQGDDVIAGGDGVDIAQFSGSFTDYHITRTEDGVWVTDLRSGGDGKDFLTDIEHLSFADLLALDLEASEPVAVNDVISIAGRTGSYTIAKAQIVGNDIDHEGEAVSIRVLVDKNGNDVSVGVNAAVVGGTAQLQASGDVLFTPDPVFHGVMSFQYKISDSQGNPGMAISRVSTGETSEIKGTVCLKTPDMPEDALFTEQWYLNDANVLPVWTDYTGKGIRIGQFEPSGEFSVGPEVFDYRHPDLAPNADADWLASGEAPTTFSQHATLVAGVMVAARNSEGTVGAAYDASLTGVALPRPFVMGDPELDALYDFKNFDVVNNSWGLRGEPAWFVKLTGDPDPNEQAAGIGRDFKGTILVYGAGNERAIGGNTNHSHLTNMRWGITVGAINADPDTGALVTGSKPFSNPGASILVSAGGSDISTTGRTFANDNGSVFGDANEDTKGTSFAAPVVSGIAALMLEANPELGYRDVQQILALSARRVADPNGTDWTYNGAGNWNGGGMHVSHDYGFGAVDALAAVRLAETWIADGTYVNEQAVSATNSASGAIPDGANYIERSFTMQAGVSVEHAELTVDLNHARLGDLIIELYSPTGTKSVLLNRPGKAPGSDSSDLGSTVSGPFPHTLTSTHHWGENSAGSWTVRIYDAAADATGTLNNLTLHLYGEQDTGNDQYIYTNEFASLFGPGERNVISDADGGSDTINAAAVSSASTINLVSGTASTIAGKTVTLSGSFEGAIGGDGNDVLTGNAISNELTGGRGNDTLQGAEGADILDGGRGNDVLTGGSDQDFFIIRKEAGSTDTLNDFGPGLGIEKVILVGFGITDFTELSVAQSGSDTHLNLGDGQLVILKNVATTQLSEQSFMFISDTGVNSASNDLDVLQFLLAERSSAQGDNGVQTLSFAPGPTAVNYFAMGGDDSLGHSGDRSILDGGDGNDYIEADYQAPVSGFDWVEGGSGNDTLWGGGFEDLIVGGSGNDFLHGEQGTDYLRGDSGSDALYGEEDGDILIGGPGDDHLNGGSGNDTLLLEGDFGWVLGANWDFYGTRVGGTGTDRFKITAADTVSWDAFEDTGSVGGTNLVADFEINQAGEQIDLSALTWIKAFSDLSITYTSLGGGSIATVRATDGTSNLTINLWGVANGQLKAGHFTFAAEPHEIFGSSANDTLAGDSGSNFIDGRAGADSMTGRIGDDAYIVENVGDTVTELPGGGHDSVQSSVSFTLGANVENLVLIGAANVDGTGNAERNRLTGNAGNNRLDGGSEADVMIGGAGNDVYVVNDQSDSAVETAAGGTDRIESSVSYILSPQIENLTLTGVDSINATGNTGANQLVGNAADNVLDGATGADTLTGGAGNDTLFHRQFRGRGQRSCRAGFRHCHQQHQHYTERRSGEPYPRYWRGERDRQTRLTIG